MSRFLVSVLLFLICFSSNPFIHAQNDVVSNLRNCNFTEMSDVEHLVLGAVILNIESREGCAENLDTLFPVASVPKLFIGGAYYELVAREELEFDTPITFTANYLMNGRNDCLTRADVGKTFTLGFLSDIMISCSDNSATWMLMDAIGHDMVQNYVDRLGIPDIGPILPYSEVDKLKLTFLDARWGNVPTHIASQFYRGGRPAGLVPNYFPEMPDYSLEERIEANARYFENYNYNTITPRAMISYLLRLRDDLLVNRDERSQIAFWTFNTMILTQRQYSTQDIPGTRYVGAKNGFDYGLTAEVNIILSSFDTRIPEAISIVFAYQDGFDVDELQLPFRKPGVIDQFLLELSPRISFLLYRETIPPPITLSPNVTYSIFNDASLISECWQPYVDEAYADEVIFELKACWQIIPDTVEFDVGQQMGLGIILEDLQTRPYLTFVYNAPDGRKFSYQFNRPYQSAGGYYWFHHLDTPGIWEIEVYQNLQRAYAQLILVEETE